MIAAIDDYLDWVIQTNAGRQPMKNYVALVADATGTTAMVYVQANSWHEVVNTLEEIGCEVVENQTDDYDEEDFASPASLEEVGVLTLDQLKQHTKNCVFVPYMW